MKMYDFVIALYDGVVDIDCDERDKIIVDSLNRCSPTVKSLVIMEELNELGQAVSKMARDDVDGAVDNQHWYNLIEEMADVYICMEFLKRKYNVTDSLIDKAISIKLTVERQRNDKYFSEMCKE